MLQSSEHVDCVSSRVFVVAHAGQDLPYGTSLAFDVRAVANSELGLEYVIGTAMELGNGLYNCTFTVGLFVVVCVLA